MSFARRWAIELTLLFSIFMSAGCALSPAARTRLTKDWRFAETIRGLHASPLHRKIFGDSPLDGRLYKRFFDTRVDAVKGEGIGFASCHGTFACTTESHQIRLTSLYAGLRVPRVIRLSFLIHEARHAEGFRHQTCPDPLLNSQGKPLLSPYQKQPLSGSDECDVDPLGATGVQIVMLENIHRYCDQCSARTRQQAGAYVHFLMRLITSSSARSILQKDFED